MHFVIAPETAQLLQRVQNDILRSPEHFDMRTWVGTPDSDESAHKTRLRTCATTACIAGWIVIEDWFCPISLEDLLAAKQLVNIEGRALSILQQYSIVDYESVQPLFHLEKWPIWAANRYDEILNSQLTDKDKRKQLARLAVARIQYWIDNLE